MTATTSRADGMRLADTSTPTIGRRGFLLSLPAFVMTRRLMAPPAGAPISIRAFNHVSLTVSDLKRSIDFYQGLFGMPVQARQSATNVQLRIGSGPQYLGLSTSADAGPAIDHMCVGIEEFNVDRIVKLVADHGVTRSDHRGAMNVHVRMRGPEAGGAKGGTPEVYLGDPDGIILQLQDWRYCGGSGALGDACAAPEAPPKRGLVALRRYSHCTVFASDAQRSNAFYQQLFGMGVRSYQGPASPTLAIGSGVEFLMVTGGGGARGGAGAAPPRPPAINHFCVNVEGFDADRILKTLETYGIKARENQTGPVGPMRSYVSMRMENRGGAREGTPELYFTDPDGILVQIQDESYCGGSGPLGSICPAL
jgi:catechol 2,3-dioxygenase-like lactoylglutathione lyase family enzyme